MTQSGWKVAVYRPAARGLPSLVVTFEDGKVHSAEVAHTEADVRRLQREQRAVNKWRRDLDKLFTPDADE